MAEIVVGRLVLADAVVPGRIEFEDGWIRAVEPDAAGAGGPVIAPGFIDVHVHGWGGHPATGDAAALSGIARALLRRGVTSFLPTAPSPVNGFYFYVRRDETVEMNISVDMALKYIVSMGVVAPSAKAAANNYPGD